MYSIHGSFYMVPFMRGLRAHILQVSETHSADLSCLMQWCRTTADVAKPDKTLDALLSPPFRRHLVKLGSGALLQLRPHCTASRASCFFNMEPVTATTGISTWCVLNWELRWSTIHIPQCLLSLGSGQAYEFQPAQHCLCPGLLWSLDTSAPWYSRFQEKLARLTLVPTFCPS